MKKAGTSEEFPPFSEYLGGPYFFAGAGVALDAEEEGARCAEAGTGGPAAVAPAGAARAAEGPMPDFFRTAARISAIA